MQPWRIVSTRLPFCTEGAYRYINLYEDGLKDASKSPQPQELRNTSLEAVRPPLEKMPLQRRRKSDTCTGQIRLRRSTTNAQKHSAKMTSNNRFSDMSIFNSMRFWDRPQIICRHREGR